MSEIDFIKERISYLKVWLGIFVASLLGLVGWIGSNFEKVSEIRVIFSLAAILWLLFSIHFLNKKIMQKIDLLRDV